MMPIIIVIHADTFLKNELYSLFTDTFTEMNQFRRGTWCKKCELLYSTRILITIVFAPLFYQRII